MREAILLAACCAVASVMLATRLCAAVEHWWRERCIDPARHRGDFWLWSREDPQEVEHE